MADKKLFNYNVYAGNELIPISAANVEQAEIVARGTCEERDLQFVGFTSNEYGAMDHSE